MRWGIPANTSPPTALPISPPFGSSSTGKTEFASQASGGDPNSVFPVLLEPNGGEIANAVGGDVFAGIPHLIDQLLRHARHTDPPARTGMLGDLERPIRPRLHDRVADSREHRDPCPAH